METIAERLQTIDLDLVLLELANVCYIDQSKGSEFNYTRAEAIKKALQALPPIPVSGNASDKGYFDILWGPGETEKNANLAYLAGYWQGERPLQTEASIETPPEFLVVAIRGTDIGADLAAKMRQLYEDFAAAEIIDWQKHLNGLNKALKPRGCNIDYALGHVAMGTVNGFNRIINMMDELDSSNTTLIQALWDIAGKEDAPYKNVPIVVTGHSLGGGQTQVVASYLAWQLDGKGTAADNGQPSRVIPVAFAPPTAGNIQFADIYAEWFPNNRYWMNKLDLVPQGFWNLIWTKDNLWDGHKFANSNPIVWPPESKWKVVDHSGKPGPGLPVLLEFLVSDKFLNGIEGKGYARPIRGVIEINQEQVLPTPTHIVQKLPNIKEPTSAIGMLQWQHFPPAYHEFIKNEYPTVIDYPLILQS